MLEEVAAQGEMLEPPTTFALPFGGVPLRAPLPEVQLPTAIYSNYHFPSNQAQLVAMRRGVAYFVRYAMDDLLGRGIAVRKLHIVGGGTKSQSFCQLLADASGIPVCIFGSNAASAGAAILAATVNQNADERCHFVNRRKEGRLTLRPHSEHRAIYDAGYRLFRHHLHAALRQTDDVLGACPEYAI
jgi:sugar (pentulose or hexulose) kinase